ncbi:hypothetical protein BDC45DRAFT_159300 [Circinella umbellata]|nr:hypothetical protein BDC45DRAFT_159300 [Circinella umbellata]
MMAIINRPHQKHNQCFILVHLTELVLLSVVIGGTTKISNGGESFGKRSQALDDDQENQATKHSYEDEVHELLVIDGDDDDDDDSLWPHEDYENINDPSVAQEEEEDENDPDPRSDLTCDYRPTRTLGYTLENVELDSNVYEELFTNTEYASSPADIEATHYEDTWIVNRFNVVNALKSFRTLSSSLNPKKLSDLRLLALNHIYLFSLKESQSIIQYMNVYGVDDKNGYHV